MAYRRRLKNKKLPEGWELIEEVIEDFEAQMKEAVNEEHEGRRKNELTWKIHRIHWEKNRFIYDLMYVRKVMSKELVRVHSFHISDRFHPCNLVLHFVETVPPFQSIIALPRLGLEHIIQHILLWTG